MRKIIVISIIASILVFVSAASAHSGGTDMHGGHYVRGTDEYHYHHGYPAHQHPGGVCPYSFNYSSFSRTSGSSIKANSIGSGTSYYNNGYANGYKAGLTAGYNNGAKDGWNNGHAAGYKAGVSEGYKSGNDYNAGYKNGHAKGYIKGYDTGAKKARENIEKQANEAVANLEKELKEKTGIGCCLIAIIVVLFCWAIYNTVKYRHIKQVSKIAEQSSDKELSSSATDEKLESNEEINNENEIEQHFEEAPSNTRDPGNELKKKAHELLKSKNALTISDIAAYTFEDHLSQLESVWPNIGI